MSEHVMTLIQSKETEQYIAFREKLERQICEAMQVPLHLMKQTNKHTNKEKTT